jgi:hypothetical protein
VRKTLRRYAARNQVEQRIGSVEEEMRIVARRTRERLVNETPWASDQEIAAKLDRILKAGRKRTRDEVPATRGIPKEVTAARRAARRGMKRNGRPARR